MPVPDQNNLKGKKLRPHMRIVAMGIVTFVLSVFNVIVASSPENYEVKQNLALQLDPATLMHSFSILVIASFLAHRAKVLYEKRWKRKL